MITALKGLKVNHVFNIMPRWVLLPLIALLQQREKKTLGPNDVSMESLVPTAHFDMQLVKEMDSTLESFAGMRAEVLLMGGEKSPAYLRVSLSALSQMLPHVKRIQYPDLDHSGPNVTAPELVSKDLRAFFSAHC